MPEAAVQRKRYPRGSLAQGGCGVEMLGARRIVGESSTCGVRWRSGCVSCTGEGRGRLGT
eukprot:7081667-Alexandrium_andersonii.AAC.1